MAEMSVETSFPEIGTIIVSALIDSINPCAIGVMIVLVGLLAGSKNEKMKSRLLYYGGIYIAAVFVTYLLAGLGLLFIFNSIPLWVAQYISLVVGLFVVLAGITEIKDYFWYGKGFSLMIPADKATDIRKYMEQLNPRNLILLGIFVAAVELPCTGGPYLAIVLLLKHRFDVWAFLLMLLYNLIFVLPLVAILLAVHMGADASQLKEWKRKHAAFMRLAIGLLLIGLGWLLIFIANGTINLG